MNEIRLFSYKMTHDTGFAPNPFGCFLTLATCKPLIRKHKKIGDWIAGFTSKKLNNDNVGEERLVYLMKVTEKLTFADYWEKYKQKRPDKDSDDLINLAGDNIYKPIGNGQFEQIKNDHHNEKHQERDLSGKYVLISDDFYYFGSEPLTIEPNDRRPNIPRGQAAHGALTKDQERAKKFIEYVKKNIAGVKRTAPHKLKDKLNSKNFTFNKTPKCK